MPQLNGRIQTAPSGLLGFDTDTKLSADAAQKIFNAGYKFCIRYLSLGLPEQRDLTYEEASAILDAGLALMPVQHVRFPGWIPSATQGKTDGEFASNNASTAGLPKGVNVWCDLEGVNSSTKAQDVIDYCNAWYDAVSAGGYVPGLYVGANSNLDSNQLSSLKFQHYWKSGSIVPPVAGKGYQIIQTLPSMTVNGIQIDKDMTQTDNQGGQALWIVKGAVTTSLRNPALIQSQFGQKGNFELVVPLANGGIAHYWLDTPRSEDTGILGSTTQLADLSFHQNQ